MSGPHERKLAALTDAHASLAHGGLEEVTGRRGTVFVGAHPDLERAHHPRIVGMLHARGLLEVLGSSPMRIARITEAGLLELDCGGEML